MLHGFMGSGRVFDHLMPLLMSHCNPVTVDLAGHGKTGSAFDADRFSTQNLVNDLTIIMDHLPSRTIYVYGYSMGGRLAYQYAVNFGKYLHGLILESSTCGFNSVTEAAERRNVDNARANEIEKDFELFLEQWRKLPLFNTGRKPDQRLLEIYKEIQQRQSKVQMARCLRGFGTGTMPLCQHSLKKLDLPVLLIAGEEDEKFRAINNNMHRLLPKSDLAIVSEAGHRIHINRPKRLAQHIIQFISK